jgi:hypothetical protein
MYSKTLNKNYKNIMYSNSDIFSVIKNRITAGNNGATIFVPHICNNIDLFGAGFAAQIAEYYPSVKADYHMLGKNFLNHNLGYSQILKVAEDSKYKHKLYFVNMIAQNGIKNPRNPRPLNYLALTKAMNNLSQYIHMNTGFINKTENIEIHAPKFGSGLAGGNWNFISDLIEDIWGKFFVTIYNYPSKK